MKAKIKAAYIAALKKTYPDIYTPESRALNLAGMAADKALAGEMLLKGECWSAALEEVTRKRKIWLLRELKALPE